MKHSIQKVLCVCKGNTCRSPLVSVLFNKQFEALGIDITADSAGLIGEIGRPVSEEMLATAMEMGLSLSSHKSRLITSLDLRQYSRIYCMDDEIRDEVLKMKEVKEDQVVIFNDREGGVPNPFGKGLAEYKNCAEIIQREVEKITGLCARVL